MKEPYNAGEEVQVKERKTKLQLLTEKQNEELRQLCNDKRARDFLWRLLSECGVYKLSFTGNSETFFNEGKRKIGLWLLSQIFEADPKIYSIMRLEAEQGDK